MRILVVQIYGLGNAIMTTPLIQALNVLGEATQSADGKFKSKHEVFAACDRKRRATWTILEDALGKGRVVDYLAEDVVQSMKFDLLILASGFRNLKTKYKIPRLISPLPDSGKAKGQTAYAGLFKKHESEYLLDAARSLGFIGGSPLPKVYSTCDVALELTGKPVAVCIGYYKGDKWSAGKHWGNQKYADLCSEMYLLGYRPLLIGGEVDHEDATEIAELAGHKVMDLCSPDMDVRTVFGVIKKCCACVGNDTGFIHAAAAMDVPTLALFNVSVSSPLKNAPLGPRTTWVSTEKDDTSKKVLEWLVKQK
jgi:ADP-heptose:LPS heptosyltransferase